MRQLVVLLMVVVGCWCQQDDTIVPETFGNDVVEASISKIRFTCIFPDDRQFVRRMAYVETNDGQVADTYPPDYDGGIWRIDEAMYDQTKTSNKPATQIHIQAIEQASSLYNIDWYGTTWEDLRKPLYSALATYLYMFDQIDRDGMIPPDIEGQADFWIDYIRPQGQRQDYIDAANTLQENCETAGGADIVFVLDGSGSIGSTNFELIKDFVIEVVEAFDVSPRSYQFGVQQYSSGSFIEFLLKDHDNQQDVVTAVENIDYLTGGTNTYLALLDLVDISFGPDSGARGPESGFQQIAFVMTDGESGNEQATIEAALRVHDNLITTYAISIGSNIRESELYAIASDPNCIHYYALENADEFVSIIESIKKSTCDAPLIFGENDTDTTVGEFLPGEGLNCQIFIPDDGTTCKVSPDLGSVNFYVAADTYPSPSYYQGLEISYKWNTGVMYIPGDLTDLIYCHILNNGSFAANVTLGCFPGNEDHCVNDNVVCQNGGVCNDLFEEGWECSCRPGFDGEFCEVDTDTTTAVPTTTDVPATTTVNPDCDYCNDGPCDCQGVYAPNPCPPCAGPDDDGVCFPGNLRPHYVFDDGTNADRFCQCDNAGSCFEFDCQAGLIYLECINGCAFPGTACP